MAIPSLDDLRSTYHSTYWNRHFFWLFQRRAKLNKNLHPVSIVGHIDSPSISLFIYQCTDKFRFNPKEIEYEVGILEGMHNAMDVELGDRYHELDFSNKDLPKEAARYLSSRGHLKANVIYFNNQTDYEDEIANLDDFSLIYPTEWSQLNLF